MENIIKMVVSIDQKASEIMKETQQYLETRERDIKDKIEAMRSDIMAKTKIDARELYESIVRESEEEAEVIRTKTREECNELEGRFSKFKDKLEKQLFSRIFS
jgi:predicted lipase